MARFIALNVGNTHTLMALAGPAGLEGVQRSATAEFVAGDCRGGLLAEHPALPCFAACVVPAAAIHLRQNRGRRLGLVRPALIRGLDLAGVDCSTVGADRLANLVAALDVTAPPYIVLDCGTAITTVAVDGRARFRGGAILPGRRLWRRALHEHTAQLPDIELAGTRPPALGTCTVEAIRAGIDLGVLGAVQRLLAETRTALGVSNCPVLTTGGDQAYFLANLAALSATPPDFTLRGVVRIARDNGFDEGTDR